MRARLVFFPLPRARQRFHRPQQRRNLPPIRDGISRVAAVLVSVPINLRSARRHSAVHSATTVRHGHRRVTLSVWPQRPPRATFWDLTELMAAEGCLKSGSIQSQRRTTQAARRAGGRVKSGVCAATAIWNSP